MKKYVMYILANNLSYIDSLLKYFPKEGYDHTDIYLVNDDIHLKDIKGDLKELTKKYNNKYVNNMKVLSGKEIVSYYLDKLYLTEIGKNNLIAHAMNIHILLYDYGATNGYEATIYTDDDVFIFGSIEDIIKNNDANIISTTFNLGIERGRNFNELYDILCTTFDKTFSIEDLSKNMLINGTMILRELPNLRYYISKFYNNKNLSPFVHNFRKYPYEYESFLLDLVFISTYCYCLKGINYTVKNLEQMKLFHYPELKSNLFRFDFSKYIICHYYVPTKDKLYSCEKMINLIMRKYPELENKLNKVEV